MTQNRLINLSIDKEIAADIDLTHLGCSWICRSKS